MRWLLATFSATMIGMSPGSSSGSAILVFLCALCGPALIDWPANAETGQSQAGALGQTHPEVAELIRQLGDPSFAVREQAENRLLAIGGVAQEQLKMARFANDSEVRMRARRILVLVQQQDYRLRLKGFLESSDPNDDFGLHGWREFEEVFGSDRSAREFFVAMQQKEAELFRAIPRGLPELEEKLRATCVLSLNDNLYSHPRLLESLAAVLLIVSMDLRQSASETMPTVHLSAANHRSLAMALNSPHIETQIKNGEMRDGFRSLMLRWLMALPDDDDELTRWKISAADKFELRELVPSAVGAMKNVRLASDVRSQAISVVARFGGDEQVGDLEQQLEDITQIHQDRHQSFEVQIRDLALAALVYLEKQRYSDFGFELYEGANDRFIDLQKAGFRSEEKRRAAIQKWHEFHSQQANQDR